MAGGLFHLVLGGGEVGEWPQGSVHDPGCGFGTTSFKKMSFLSRQCVTSSFVPLTYYVSSKNGPFEPVLKNMTNVLTSRTCLSLLRLFSIFFD